MTPRQMKEFRKRINITQLAFAKGLGVSVNTVARWERGELGMRDTTRRLLERLIEDVDLTHPVWPPTTQSKGE